MERIKNYRKLLDCNKYLFAPFRQNQKSKKFHLRLLVNFILHNYNPLNLYYEILLFFTFLFFINNYLHTKENPIVINNTTRFTIITPECIRLEYSKEGKFIDSPSIFAVNRNVRFNDFSISRKDNKKITIDTGKIKLEYTFDEAPFNKNNLKALIKKGDKETIWTPEQKNTGNLGGTLRTLDGIKEPVEIGEGLLSRDGWYLFDDSRTPILTKDWIASRPKDSGIDWYLFGYGYDFKNALKSMASIAGSIPLPRKYALGSWYSRYWPYSSREYKEIINEYKQHDFPLDIIVLDMDWHKAGWTGWSWNRDLLPDAEELLKWFHEQNLFVTLNVHPADGVGPHEDMYENFMKDMGREPTTKETIPFDAGNKKYLDTLFKHTHIPKEEEGVDFWWLDWQQYPYTISIPDLTNLAWLNHYYFKHSERNGKRGLSFSRWGGWGDHRYPIHFSGDASTDWSMLAFEIPFTSTAGNVGVFFWSHDIGGHMGSRNEESFARWVQFGATTAALRLHSTRSTEHDRRPWTYPSWVENSTRISFHLRSRLFPYIYSSAWQSHKNTIPLNRPMYIHYPEIERSYTNPQQYFFGDAFLVAPITSEGIGPTKISQQIVWFPEGIWYNWFTGEKFQGNSEIIASANINEFPLYVKAGVPIPLQPYTQRMTTTPLENLIIRVFPGENNKKETFTLYEDDGITNEYQNGQYALTHISYLKMDKIVKIEISSVEGKYSRQVLARTYTIELPCSKKANLIKVSNKNASLDYDSNYYTNKIYIPKTKITTPVEITLEVEEVDFDELSANTLHKKIEELTGEKVVGKTKKEIILNALQKQTDKKNIESILSIAGIAWKLKNEKLYLYKGKEQLYFYAPQNLIDNDNYYLKVEDHIGKEIKTILTSSKQAGEPFPPNFTGLPELTSPNRSGITSRRLLKSCFNILNKPFELEIEIDNKKSYIKKWKVIGPLTYNPQLSISENHKEIDNEILNHPAFIINEEKQKLHWRLAKADKNGYVNLSELFLLMGTSGNRLAYAKTKINTEVSQEITLLINRVDSGEVWLNGIKVFSSDIKPEKSDSLDIIKISLKSGENVLLLKICQRNLKWGFRVSVESPYPITF